MKEIKYNTERYTFSWIGRINIAKMTIPPKAIYRFNTIPIKLQIALFIELEQIFFNFHGNTAPLNRQCNPEKVKRNWRNQAP